MDINGECNAGLLAQASREYWRLLRLSQSLHGRRRFYAGVPTPQGVSFRPVSPELAHICSPEELDKACQVVDQMLARLANLLGREVMLHPVWGWARNIKGLSPTLLGLVLGYFVHRPPLPTKGVSTWWKRAGLAPIEIDGQSRLPRPRRSSEQQGLGYIPSLRRALYVLFESLARARGYYFWAYWAFRAELQPTYQAQGRPNYVLQAHQVARWKTIKLFLSHLYRQWAKAVGIEVLSPYSAAYLGRLEYEPPETDRQVEMEALRHWVESTFEPYHLEQVPDLAAAREAMRVARR